MEGGQYFIFHHHSRVNYFPNYQLLRKFRVPTKRLETLPESFPREIEDER